MKDDDAEILPGTIKLIITKSDVDSEYNILGPAKNFEPDRWLQDVLGDKYGKAKAQLKKDLIDELNTKDEFEKGEDYIVLVFLSTYKK